MKFAIIADIHLGPQERKDGVLRKMSQYSKNLLIEFIETINKDVKPDFVMALGDLIQNESKQKDKRRLTLVFKLLRKIKCPVYFLPTSRHDVRNLSEEEVKRILRYQRLYYSFGCKNYHFIALFSKDVHEFHKIIPEEQVLWLLKELKNIRRKTIVFTHPSLADQNLHGNPWFEGLPEDCLISNRKKIRWVLEKSGKVIAVFNSHLHWNKMNVHGNIPYFTLQSIIENENNLGMPAKAYTIVELAEKGIVVNVKGNYPKRFQYSFY